MEAYGNGENWGLLPGESTILPCSVPLESLRGIDTLTALTFDLISTDAADPGRVLGTVPVRITTSMDLTNAQ